MRSHLVALVSLVVPSQSPSRRILALQKVQEAVDWTKAGASNITAANQAAQLWGSLLRDTVDGTDALLPRGIQAMAHVMYASSLVRTGQDEAALDAYDAAISSYEILSASSNHVEHEQGRTRALLGQARSLQRLLRYAAAQTLYLDVMENSQDETDAAAAAVGAATCALRVGPNIAEAMDILHRFTSRAFANSTHAETSAALDLESPLGVLVVLQYLFSQRTIPGYVNEPVALSQAFVTVSPVHKWMFHQMARRGSDTRTIPPPPWPKSAFLDYCKVNVGLLDDYQLRLLDDKVLLHALLTTSATTKLFWPEGVILSASNQDALLSTSKESTDNSATLWIFKRRAGYGSHGNTIVLSSRECIMAYSTGGHFTITEDCVLVQRMVDSPLLLNGRTFSMRVYIILCGGGTGSVPQVYIATEGLVKLAAVPIDDNSPCDRSIDPRRYMTNSGRETNMAQTTFAILRGELSQPSFAEIWLSIVSAATNVMTIYLTKSADSGEKRHGFQGPPKILGFDFVVDQSHRAWLVEINRFPGLEPRSSRSEGERTVTCDEAAVKHQVVRDAWRETVSLDRGRDTDSDTVAMLRKDAVDQLVTESWLEDDFNDLVYLDKGANVLEHLPIQLHNSLSMHA